MRKIRSLGKEKDLRILDPEQYEVWMNEHSSYGDKNVTQGRIKKSFLHTFFHVISLRALGTEHYFRPECLEEAAIELLN